MGTSSALIQALQSFAVMKRSCLLWCWLVLLAQVGFCAETGPLSSLALTNVPEAAQYTLVYSLDLPAQANYRTNAVPYEIDNHATIGPFTRIAYCVQLQSAQGATQYLWVSMEAFTTNAARIGVPTFQSGAFFQQPVTNMNVRSSVDGIVTGDGLSGGNIEFWWGDYGPENTGNVPGASSATYDWGDSASPNAPPGYGSMQVHNHDAGQTLFAFNGWAGGPACDLGVGNGPGENPDWTAAMNAASYQSRKLEVYVLETAGPLQGGLGKGTTPGGTTVSVPDGSNSTAGSALPGSEVTGTAPSGSGCISWPTGLVSWWPGEGDATDLVGGHNGQLLGGVSFGAGEVGQAFSLDGSTGRVSVPATGALNLGTGPGLTLEAWINPRNASLTQCLFEWNSGRAFGAQFYLSVDPPWGTGSGCLYANLFDTSGISHLITSANGMVVPNTFQHVALTYDHASGNTAIYYNGVVVAQQNLGVFTPSTSYNLVFGYRPSGPVLAFSGQLDEASAYNRALSAAEILEVYNAGAAGKCGGNPPTVALTAPANGTNFDPLSHIILSATASANDGGSISKVEFYNGDAKLGESLAPPYQFVWSQVPAGE
jgi:hypothetical protein